MSIILLESQDITDNVRLYYININILIFHKYFMEFLLTSCFLLEMSCTVPIPICDKNSQGQTVLTEWYLGRKFRHMK